MGDFLDSLVYDEFVAEDGEKPLADYELVNVNSPGQLTDEGGIVLRLTKATGDGNWYSVWLFSKGEEWAVNAKCIKSAGVQLSSTIWAVLRGMNAFREPPVWQGVTRSPRPCKTCRGKLEVIDYDGGPGGSQAYPCPDCLKAGLMPGKA